jgi:Zinc carboxypeptidase
MSSSWISSLAVFFVLATPCGLLAQDGTKPFPPGPPAAKADKVPATPKITTPIPGDQDDEAIGKQLEQWGQQAPGLTEIGTYGKSTKGVPLRYIRVTNLLDGTPKKKLMITACIHGNEPLACSTTMAMIGTMLSEYGIETETTALINTRDIYFIPVVSPDSYPNKRRVDNVDPNRDFPHPGHPKHKSVQPIEAIQSFFVQHQFDAVISGHTFGRWYWSPFADSTEPCDHKKDYDRILGEMRAMNKYGRWFLTKRAAPEIGTEVDWYYRNGAFAIGCEYGTHQRIPTLEETKTELNKTYKAFLYFVREGPLVQVRPRE